MSLEILLRLAGAFLLTLAAAHVVIPRRFHWKDELPRLSLFNRQMLVVHTLFICVILVGLGALSLFAPQALLEPTYLARLVLGGLVCFWGTRLLVQWFVYDPALWRGDRLNTVIHVLATALWLYLTLVYAAALVLRQ